jgi:hypothetical protein
MFLALFVHRFYLSVLLDDQFHVVFDVFVLFFQNDDDAHFQILHRLDRNWLINVMIVLVYIQKSFIIKEINENI